jgi:hypothetical protein
LALPARERLEGQLGGVSESDARDGRLDRGQIDLVQGTEQAANGGAPGGDELADRDRRLEAELRALGQVADPGSALNPIGRFAEELEAARARAFEPDDQPDERRLATPVGAGDAEELTPLDREVDVVQDRRAAPVGKGNPACAYYLQPSAFRSAARFSRIRLK